MSRSGLYAVIVVLAIVVIGIGVYAYQQSQRPSVEVKLDGNGLRSTAMVVSVMSEERQQQILTAIAEELRRQSAEDRAGRPELSEGAGAHRYLVKGEVDAIALATAIDAALGADTLEAGPQAANINLATGVGASPKGVYSRTDEGKKPDELNASNDE